MKINRPSDPLPASPQGAGRAIPGYDKRQEAAIEKKRSEYIELKCGHLTTWEVDELYSSWRPEKHLYFCEKCGAWRARLTRKKVAELPPEPLW